MQDILERIARGRGLDTGDGTEVGFEFASLPQGGLALLCALLVVAGLVLVVRSYRREGSSLGRGRRLVLVTLRVAALLLIAFILTDPQVVARRPVVTPGRTLILVDGSQSMANVDRYRDEDAASLRDSWREATGLEPRETSRLDLARGLLDEDALNQLAEDNRIELFGFGASAENLAGSKEQKDSDDSVGAESTVQPVLDALAELRAERGSTDPGAAIREALASVGQADIAGVILLTDGRRNAGPRLRELADTLEARGVQRSVILPIGDPSPVRKVEIQRFDAPERIFQEDPFELIAGIRTEGYEEGTARLRLLRAGASGGETLEAERTITLSVDEPRVEVRFEDLRATASGTADWILELLPPDGSEPDPKLHRKVARVEVLEQRTRALLISGGPSHEYRALRRLLTRDDTVEVACWLQSADRDFPQDGNVSLELLPTEPEDLDSWDVFILIDPDPDRLDPAFCEAISERVRRRGAGLWWVCGEIHTRRALAEGASTAPLAQLLPVDPDQTLADESLGLARGVLEESGHLPTPLGLTIGPGRVGDDTDGSRLLWRSLPGYFFAYPFERARPGAEVLLETGAGDGSGTRPFLATRSVGVGRVLCAAGDETYRWIGLSPTSHERYWLRGVRHLFEGRLGAGSARLRLDLEREKLQLGESTRITLDARDSDLEPDPEAKLLVKATDENGDVTQLDAQPVADRPGRFEVVFRPGDLGPYTIDARIDAEGLTNEDALNAEIRVVAAELESEGPARIDALTRIGNDDDRVVVFDPNEFDAAIASIPAATREETFRAARSAWDGPFTLGLLAFLLIMEWWLRKRSDLL